MAAMGIISSASTNYMVIWIINSCTDTLQFAPDARQTSKDEPAQNLTIVPR